MSSSEPIKRPGDHRFRKALIIDAGADAAVAGGAGGAGAGAGTGAELRILPTGNGKPASSAASKHTPYDPWNPTTVNRGN